MTQHSIAELKRQLVQKESIFAQAREKLVLARKKYRAALCEQADADFAAKGILRGSRVVGRNDRNVSEVGIFQGHTSERSWSFKPEPIVRKIKKDGTAHATQNVSASFDSKWELAQ